MIRLGAEEATESPTPEARKENVEVVIWFIVMFPVPPVEVEYLFPCASKSVVTVRFVPVAFVKVRP